MGAAIQNELPLGVSERFVKSKPKNQLGPTVIPIKALRSDDQIRNHLTEELDLRLWGSSKPMSELKQAILTVARSSEAVLITGESGTGKELIARAIHDFSPRKSKPFVPINCGALAESLLESELFGHVKGAFTGAAGNKKGFFEEASGGTIFLDEFGEMSLATQQRLLRVIQEGKVRPVGSTQAKELEVDARIAVATNHDLKRDISEGKFRHDLYYRVNVLHLHSPALRDRRDDIGSLVQRFIRKYNEKNSTTVSERISSEVLSVLEAYPWPGNVRELENITKRLALNASTEGVITPEHLSFVTELETFAHLNPPLPIALRSEHQVSRKLNRLSGRRSASSVCRCKEELLDEYRNVLDETNGNLAEAARRLNLKRTTLRKRIVSLQNKCGVG